MEEGQRAESGLQRGQDRTSRESIRRSETKELVSIERLGAWETKRGAAASAGTSPPAIPPGATGGKTKGSVWSIVEQVFERNNMLLHVASSSGSVPPSPEELCRALQIMQNVNAIWKEGRPGSRHS